MTRVFAKYWGFIVLATGIAGVALFGRFAEVHAAAPFAKPSFYETPMLETAFTKFIDPLPRLAHQKISPTPGFAELNIQLQPIQWQWHHDLPSVAGWSYDATTPLPVIELQSGQALRVHWQNHLPTTHLLTAAAGMDMSTTTAMPDVRTVTHLHGAVVEQPSQTDALHNNDGWPDAYITPGQEQISEYPNQQSSRMLFFHDHAVGTTGRNVAAGLVGLYVIRDEKERSLNLPNGDFEVDLALQARGFNGDGTLYYSNNLTNEYYGNAVAINGKLWPFMQVQPRKYRFRFIDISNARSYDLQLVEDGTLKPGPAFYQIGGDGGFLENTAVLNDPNDPKSPLLSLAPAERADVIIDFSKHAGRNFILQNTNRDGKDGEIPALQLMRFQVDSKLDAPDTSQLPLHPQKINWVDPQTATLSRQIVLSNKDMGNGMQMQLLNNLTWHDPLTEKVKLGSTEIWKLVNTTTDVHPFHVHLANFQILDRTNFDMDQFSKDGSINLQGASQAADANEMGWKDVVKLYPGTVTRIIMRFDQCTGFYVYHCHILEHEDMDMMRPFEVYKDPVR